jgi:antitoxin (DNA-binding transcriptional repressor) of toxin-antitoxin stability system
LRKIRKVDSRIDQAKIVTVKIASVSELKDGLSAHLELVRSGELVVVTDQKFPVATLERIAPGTLSRDTASLVAEGIAAPRKVLLNVQPTSWVKERAIRLLRVHLLQAADAMQLTAALVAFKERTAGNRFLTADLRLAKAAFLEGFAVE